MDENRDTFLARFHTLPGKARFSELDIAKIELMYDFAKYGHRGQDRKSGERYFEHPRHVTLIIIDELGILDPVVIMIGIGHDLIEDSARYASALKIQIIAGEEVSKGVVFLSKTEERKPTFLVEIRTHGTWQEILVKCCDRLDNMRDLPEGDEEESVAFRRKQTIETRDYYLDLAAYLVEIAPPARRAACEKLRRALVDQVQARAQTLGIDPVRCAP